MKLSRLFLALAIVAASFSVASSASALDFTQPAGPWATGSTYIEGMASGDLNGDGADDVVSVNSVPGSLSVFLSNGDTLTTPVNYGQQVTPYSVALGDLDNDGNLDVVIAANDVLDVRKGNGDGTFGAPTSIAATGYDGILVATGQFSGNSNLDVIVGDYTSGNVALYLGNGTGALTPNGSVAETSQPVEAAVGDFDGNGVDDFATANSDSFFTGAISVVLVDSNGSFSPGTGSPLAGDYQPAGITSGDFNGDGDVDLAVVNSPNPGLSVKLGDGSGGFTDAPSLPAIPSHWGTSIASADFDGDGYDDLGVGWTTSTSGEVDDSTGIFLGSSSGAMSAAAGSPWANTSPTYPWLTTTGDFNGDGHPDYANGDLSGNVSAFINEVPAPAVTIDPTSHDFGSQRITVESSSHTFTVENTGNLALDVSGVSVTGTDAGQFSIVSEDCTADPIDPHDTCQVEVRFAPTTTGAKSANLSLATNADGSPQTAALTGTGTVFAYPSFDPYEQHFGSVPIGTGPTSPQTYTVTAMGASPLEFDQLNIDPNNGNPGDFSITDDDCLGESIPVGGTCHFSVEFEPGAVGYRYGFVRWYAPGIQGLLPIDGTGTDPGFSLTPTSKDFGTRLTDEGPGTPETFTLASTGTTDLDTGVVSLTGTAADQFQITSEDCSNRTLAPEENCEVAVAFGPTTAGEKAADLSVALEGLGPATAQLTGSGQDPVPPPDPCEPVTIKKVAYFTPSIKKRSSIPGVRARITTAGPAVVRVSSKVIYHLKGKQGQIKYGQRQFEVKANSLNYKVAIPKKLRSKLKPKKQVRFVITYASKANKPECTKFGSKKTRNLTTRIVWVIPNG
jgi:hypothetical protein